MISRTEAPDSWLQTFTGRQFYPLDPRPDEVEIRDIAHALAKLCRFNGHCRRFYSVAEHSLHVSALAERMGKSNEQRLYFAKWGLLHDASETYLGDVIGPLKRTPVFELYRAAERRLEVAICQKFGLGEEQPAEVKHADLVLLATEKRDLHMTEPASWGPLPLPLELDLTRDALAEMMEARFINRFRQLFPTL